MITFNDFLKESSTGDLKTAIINANKLLKPLSRSKLQSSSDLYNNLHGILKRLSLTPDISDDYKLKDTIDRLYSKISHSDKSKKITDSGKIGFESFYGTKIEKGFAWADYTLAADYDGDKGKTKWKIDIQIKHR